MLQLRRSILLASVCSTMLLPIAGCQSTPESAPAQSAADRDQHRQATLLEINRVIDDFHDAAAVADLNRYFGHLTAHAVFLGTDAWERWPRDQFREYAAPHFLGESAWAYTPRDRSVSLSESGEIAWFDEKVDNVKYGTLRGVGVLELCSDGVWRISQYNLGFTVPNEIAGDVIQMIRSSEPGANR